MRQLSDMELRKYHRIKATIFYTSLLLSSIVFIYPLIYTVLSSLKDNNEIYSNYFGLPKTIMISNYMEAIKMGKLGRAFANSAFLTAITITAQLLFSAMAAFVITRIKFRMSYLLLIYFSIG